MHKVVATMIGYAYCCREVASGVDRRRPKVEEGETRRGQKEESEKWDG